jgi:hypothetical protein
MDEIDPAKRIDDAARREARQNPNGWVYEIAGQFGPNDAVPPAAIKGAWKVDESGTIIEGSYVKNPNFQG